MEGCKTKYQKAILGGAVWGIFLLVTCSEFETKWVRKFDAFGSGNYRINSVTSTKRDLYFIGTYTPQNTISKCFLARYDADGKPEWYGLFQTPENTQAHGKELLVLIKQEELLTTHSDIYLLVETYNINGVNEAILAKYDTLGNLIWQKTATTSHGTLISTLLSDSEGNLYITGWEDNSEGKPTIFIAKYNESGEILYSIEYYSEQFNFDDLKFDIMEPQCFALAGLLNSTNELFYIKYNDSGQFQGMVNYKARAAIKTISDLKITPNGTIFISADISNVETGDDILTLAYNSKDSLLWANEYDGDAHGDDHCKAISVDESLNVYVTGSTANAEGIPNIVTMKYDKSGNHIWTQDISQRKASEPLIMEPRYLRLDRRPPLAYLYIAGAIGNDAMILRCNTNGVYSFQAKYGERGKVTMPTALSEKYMAMERTAETGVDAFIAKYGPSVILGITRWD